MLDPVVQVDKRGARRSNNVGLAGIALGAIVLAACQAGPSADDGAKLHQQAEAALARWADAVATAGGQSPIVLVGEPTGQVGDWEAAVEPIATAVPALQARSASSLTYPLPLGARSLAGAHGAHDAPNYSLW